MRTDFELKYTEYRWKGRQLRMLRHKYFLEAIRAAVQKKTTSEAIQKAQMVLSYESIKNLRKINLVSLNNNYSVFLF